MTQLEFLESDSLNELRTRSLRVIALYVGIIAYFWAVVVVWPITGQRLPAGLWTSVVALIFGASFGYVYRESRPILASWVLILGVLAAVASVVLAFRSLELTYLCILAIVFASVLLSEVSTFVTVGLVALFMVTVIPRELDISYASLSLWLPVAIMVLTALGSWLSARNLHMALAWVWSGYARARANEEEARQRRAELRRALNALDEATYRLQRSRNELLVARQLAEEAKAMKEQFVTTVSHELRTPLNLITGFAEMMYLSPESYEGVTWTPDLENDIHEMFRASRHLCSLVNDILDLSRIDASRLPMYRELFDVRSAIAEAMETMAPLLKQRGLAYDVRLPEVLPQIVADRTRIRQVLINLLNNAVRFTDSGSVIVEAELTDDAIQVSVRDTGIGIPPDQLEGIFEEFHQVNGGTHRRGGTGLGLALSRQFVSLHGGRIWAESNIGQGSSFHFTLPLPSATPQVAQLRHTPDQRPVDFPASSILVVDPDAAVADMLSRYLGDHPIHWVSKPEEAEENVEKEHPLGIIINEVPGAPPQSWLGPLGTISKRYNVPVFRCSLPSASWLQRTLGLCECLTKPVSREAVQQTVTRYLNGAARVLVVDDDPGFVGLMTRMLHTMQRVVEVIPAYSGSQALRLLEAVTPDLIFLDLLMPEVDGFQVLESVHHNPALAQVPVVAVTATSYVEDALMRRGGFFTLTQPSGLSPGTITELLRQSLQVVRPNYNPDMSA
jgi:signal transduction histidine kinase/CheY-like chemotaxis protein